MSQPRIAAVLPPDARPAYALHRRSGEAAEPVRAGLRRGDVAGIIESRQFALVFQPVVRLTDRAVVYREALLRPHPPQGVATRVFVDVAGEFGLAAALDTAVLDAALEARARAGGPAVSVNLAASSIGDAAFVRAALARIGGAGPGLLLELPASAAIANPAALADGIAAFQLAGVRVCLDGLGPDAAALACVRLARFDQMKLDGATVRAAAEGERGRRLLAALLALAKVSGAETVAKHIETLPQAWLMQDMGISLGQGWLFGAPGGLAGGVA